MANVNGDFSTGAAISHLIEDDVSVKSSAAAAAAAETETSLTLTLSREELDSLDLTLADLLQHDQQLRDIVTTSSGPELRRYSHQIALDVQQHEAALIQDYVQHADATATLHQQLRQCDTILENMQTMLTQFQGDLGAISDEIQTIQQRSFVMNVKVKNRKAADAKLSAIIDQLFVNEDLINAIMEAPIDDHYMQTLELLDHKIQAVTSLAYTRAAQDIHPIIDKLRLKTLQRIRVFLIDKFEDLRKPKTNISIKQRVLVKYSPITTFLRKYAIPSEGSDLYTEIRNLYVQTMQPIYQKKFRDYLESLKKRQMEPLVWKTDLLGAESSIINSGSLFSTSTKKTGLALDAVFKLAGRESLLLKMEDIVIPGRLQDGDELSFEQIFKTVLHLLIDTALEEYDFLTSFFSKHENAQFEAVFKKVSETLFDFVHENISSCFDVISILLAIRILEQSNLVMLKRNNHCLDTFFDRVNMALWPRWKALMEEHISSVMQVAKVSTNRERTPHFIVIRYAELASAILRLSPETDDIVISMLKRARHEIEKLLQRSAAYIANPRDQLVFMIRSYQTIVHILARHLSQHQLLADNGNAILDSSMTVDVSDIEELSHWKELTSNHLALYVEEELSDYFGDIIRFVKNIEAKTQAGPEHTSIDALVSQINTKFASSWRSSFESLSRSIVPLFATPEQSDAGKMLLKQTLVQMLLYYRRFCEIVKTHCQSNTQLLNALIPTATLTYEIKRFTADSNMAEQTV